MNSEFTDPYIEKIAPSIRAGHYNLLIGAGVSLDSCNFSSAKVPGSEALKQQLCTLKGAKPASTLQRVFSTLTAAEIAEHVTPHFCVEKPGPSVLKITQFLWRRVYTWNIDDAVEVAYAQSSLLQRATTFNYQDPYVESGSLLDVPIIHLHGWVRSPNQQYVFSASEYARQISSINAWMVTLSAFLAVEPFIIAGTSLDEVDLEYYVAHRTAVTPRSDRGPSIFVDRSPDAITKQYCDAHGMLLFEGDAVEFFDYLDKHVPHRPRPIELVDISLRDLLPESIPARDAMSFGSDFELVPAHLQGTSQKIISSRFFYGHPPSWPDLADSLDIGRDATTRVVAEVDRCLNPSEPHRIVLLMESTGSGKTTILRRAAFDFANRGINVIMCSALSSVEPTRTAKSS